MIKLPSALVLGLRIKSTHPVTELLSMFSVVEEILFHTVKNWGGGLRLTPSRMGKILVGGWHSELGVEPPNPL